MYDPKKPSTDIVLNLIKSTWNTSYLKITPSTYAIFKKKFNYSEVDHTDGIGTKGIYHWKKETFENAVLDSLAMNLNDLLLVRAQAYKLQNHLVLPKDDEKIIRKIMKKMVTECKKRNIAITGGETSIHNTPNSFDIGITVSGFVKKIILNKVKTGDLVIGIKSNGVHSNGFTLIRKIFGNKVSDEFIKPTKIYYDDLIDLLDELEIHGMMHITGGAFSKLKGIIDKNQDILVTNQHKIKPQKIFFDMFNKGIANKQMYTTFNCGIGFILTASRKNALKITKEIPDSAIIGEVKKGTGKVIIKSSFNNRTLVL